MQLRYRRIFIADKAVSCLRILILWKTSLWNHEKNFCNINILMEILCGFSKAVSKIFGHPQAIFFYLIADLSLGKPQFPAAAR
jgi:hypothetical protein